MEDHPLTQDADGGGPVLMYSHLELFAHSGAAITLALLRRGYGSLGFERYTESDPETWARVRGWCEAHHLIRIPKAPARDSARLKHFLLSVRDPGSYLFGDVTPEVAGGFRKLVSESGADLIWAENLFAGVLATHAQSEVPVVFSHHDRIFKLIRNWGANTESGWRRRYDSWTGDRLENRIIRRAIACASGSAVEARDLGRVNGRPVVYLPTTYPRLPPSRTAEIPETARIVHLGGMNTVANRRGLERFLAVSWPRLRNGDGKPPELWIVGDLTGAPDSLHADLARSGAVLTGFVRDLSQVLRPGDIHIVPWEHATGTRTRIPVILRHGQVLLSTRAAAACLPELRDGEDCVLVDDLTEMAAQARRLTEDRDERARLGRAARRAFERHFVREAVQPRFDAFLDQVAPEPRTRAAAPTERSRREWMASASRRRI
jgi:glycosyltransferase involved in cell wall biosynthesis